MLLAVFSSQGGLELKEGQHVGAATRDWPQKWHRRVESIMESLMQAKDLQAEIGHEEDSSAAYWVLSAFCMLIEAGRVSLPHAEKVLHVGRSLHDATCVMCLQLYACVAGAIPAGQGLRRWNLQIAISRCFQHVACSGLQPFLNAKELKKFMESTNFKFVEKEARTWKMLHCYFYHALYFCERRYRN